jgi:hypothetical protein
MLELCTRTIIMLELYTRATLLATTAKDERFENCSEQKQCVYAIGIANSGIS